MKVLCHSIIAVVAILAVGSCKEVEEPTTFGDEFYPIDIGYTWVYDVDSTYFDAFSNDSVQMIFQRKEEVISSFLPVENQSPVYVVSISTRKDSTSTWKYVYTCTKSTDTYKAVRNDGNLPIVKLVYPIKNLKSWDANQLNINDKELYRYRNVQTSHEVNGTVYGNSFKVDQSDILTPFSEWRCWEIYAENVGLVEKTFIKTNTEGGKKGGVAYYWKLRSFVKN